MHTPEWQLWVLPYSRKYHQGAKIKKFILSNTRCKSKKKACTGFHLIKILQGDHLLLREIAVSSTGQILLGQSRVHHPVQRDHIIA